MFSWVLNGMVLTLVGELEVRAEIMEVFMEYLLWD